MELAIASIADVALKFHFEGELHIIVSFGEYI